MMFRMRGAGQRCALFALALVAALAAGCGGRTRAENLHHRLLSVADLPAGWSATTTGKNAPTANGPCFAQLPKQSARFTYESAAFVEGTSIPNLGEVLATGPEVRQTWTRLSDALARCRTATLGLGRTKVRAAVHPLALAKLAAHTSAYAWTFTLGGIEFGFDLVLFRTSSYDGILSYADLGSPPPSTVTAFVRAAIAKAASGSTAPVPDSVSIASAPVRTVHTTDGTVAYRTIGSGSPLLLVTGYSGTMEGWDRRFVDALARDHRVITFDNAGIGKTDAVRPLTIDAMANQTSALIDALDLKRPDVLGWSMGSMIAQALAVLHPQQVRRLVLCASFPGDATAVPPSRTELDAFESGRPQDVLAALFPDDQIAAQNAYLAAVSSYPSAPPAPADALIAQKRAVDGWWNGLDPAGKRADTITAPTLLADGTGDRLDPTVNSRELARLIATARLELYPDAGHAFLFQDQARFVRLVDAFLR